ncbi:hypothetical protein B0J17DRAFT_709673 [Rhizoctonia solani]|nr:hypothetical protein B0J17DRAFT_709673 [Rhizoctonia solani]
MFNSAFEASRAACLEGAKEAVARTSAVLNDPQRDCMWATIWECWENIWNSIKDDCRRIVVVLLMESVDDLMKIGATALMVVLRNDDSQPLEASFTPKFQVTFSSFKVSTTINEIFLHKSQEQANVNQMIILSNVQSNIIESMRDSYPRAFASDSYVERIKHDMAKNWNMSQQYFQTELPVHLIQPKGLESCTGVDNEGSSTL